MNYTFLIIFILTSSPNLLLQVCSNSTKTVAALQENTKSTTIPPKLTTYFYQEPKGPGTYEFGYDLEDKPTKNTQFRNETRSPNGTVVGSYGFLRADGIFTIVNYVADLNGYRTRKNQMLIKNQDQLLSSSEETNQATTTTSTTTTTATTEIPGLNLTSGTLPPLLVDTVMDKFQIDLSADASPGDILHPNISDIISGKVPLKNDKKNSQLGFDVVQNFIPSNFPIAPFQLPTEMPSKSMDN